jgi:hypothetical protein
MIDLYMNPFVVPPSLPTPINAMLPYKFSILCRTREFPFVVLRHGSVCLARVSIPRRRTFRKVALTSDTFLANLVSLNRDFPAGTFQLLTPHHHRRILAPTPCPLNFADLFQCRQPLSRSVHSTPWAKQKMTCPSEPMHHLLLYPFQAYLIF